jgi:hypothetical protein
MAGLTGHSKGIPLHASTGLSTGIAIFNDGKEIGRL